MPKVRLRFISSRNVIFDHFNFEGAKVGKEVQKV
jgi:hypothetical protein